MQNYGTADLAMITRPDCLQCGAIDLQECQCGRCPDCGQLSCTCNGPGEHSLEDLALYVRAEEAAYDAAELLKKIRSDRERELAIGVDYLVRQGSTYEHGNRFVLHISLRRWRLVEDVLSDCYTLAQGAGREID